MSDASPVTLRFVSVRMLLIASESVCLTVAVVDVVAFFTVSDIIIVVVTLLSHAIDELDFDAVLLDIVLVTQFVTAEFDSMDDCDSSDNENAETVDAELSNLVNVPLVPVSNIKDGCSDVNSAFR